MQPSTTTWILGSSVLALTIVNTVCNGLVALPVQQAGAAIKVIAFTALGFNVVAVTSLGFSVAVRLQLTIRRPVIRNITFYRQLNAASITLNTVALPLSLILLIWIALRNIDLPPTLIHSTREFVVLWSAILGFTIISQVVFYSHVMLSTTQPPIFQIISPATFNSEYNMSRNGVDRLQTSEAFRSSPSNNAELLSLPNAQYPPSECLSAQRSRFSASSLESDSQTAVMSLELQDMHVDFPRKRNTDEELSIHEALRMTFNSVKHGRANTERRKALMNRGWRGSSVDTEIAGGSSSRSNSVSCGKKCTTSIQSIPEGFDSDEEISAGTRSRSSFIVLDRLSSTQSQRSTLWGTATFTSIAPDSSQYSASTTPSSPADPLFLIKQQQTAGNTPDQPQHPFFRIHSLRRGTTNSSRKTKPRFSTTTHPTIKALHKSQHQSLMQGVDMAYIDEKLSTCRILSELQRDLKVGHLVGQRNSLPSPVDEDTTLVEMSDLSTPIADAEALRRVHDVFGAQANLLRLLAGQENAMKGLN